MKKEVICSTCGKTLTGRQIGGHRSAYPDHVIGAPVVPDPNTPPPKDDKPKDGSQPGGTFVTITAPRPASVVFTLAGDHKIEVDPQKFYECYLLYLDMKQKLNMEDDFSTALLDSIGMAWRFLCSHPVIEGEAVRLDEIKSKGG